MGRIGVPPSSGQADLREKIGFEDNENEGIRIHRTMDF